MRCPFAVAALLVAVPASAGTISGKVDVIDRGGKPAADLTNVVVFVDGAKVKPRPARPHSLRKFRRVSLIAAFTRTGIRDV